MSHEPYIQDMNHALKDKGLHPFYLPLSIKLNEVDRRGSACIRCDTCDGFPCLINAKADADINAVRPAIAEKNLQLITGAKVVRLHTSASGREVTGVEAEIAGQYQMFSGDIVVVACGAVNSAVLLLQSANEQHPNGLANSSQMVGRNYMTHNFGVVMSLSRKPNPTMFNKTLAVNDFYWGEAGFPYPMGSVQLLGNVNADKIAAYGSPLVTRLVAGTIASHCVAWLLMTEDLADENNRVSVKNGSITLAYKRNNTTAFNRLLHRWTDVLRSLSVYKQKGDYGIHIAQKMGMREVGHQCGTCRFGEDAKTSVLDINCRTHDVDNLYVVDSSFFPSSSAVNPSLTIMANALRVGEHLLTRLG